MESQDISDEIDDIVFDMAPAQRIARLRERIAEFAPGEDGRAAFLCALAGELNMAGDLDGARTASLAAIDDGGPTTLDPRCGLLMNELHAGDQVRADEILGELLARVRAGLLGETECEWIAGSLEEADRLKDAHRWYTIPVRDIDPEDIDELPIHLLDGRYRVRRELGLPLDAYDEARDLLDRLDSIGS